MQIWSTEIKELEKLNESFKGYLPDLEKELEKLVKADDENMVLLYSRRCLEVIITDLCECELKRPRGTEPLKGIIDKLSHEKKVPSNIIASMEGLNTLSTFGTHPKDFDPEQVKPVLNNLTTIIKWYLKYKDTQATDKTKPEEPKYESKELDDSTKDTRKPKKRLVLLLSGFLLICVVVIMVLFIFNIVGGRKSASDRTEFEKSIAVLPFISLSDDPEKQYLADGMMDAILLHLSKIEDLRVMSRTSVEQYRETDKTSSVIGKELGVAYLLEGSFQKYGDNARLIVQLIKTGKEGHEWANDYDRNWNDIFSVQSEVAQTIARELHAVISPEEKQLIEKTPTTSLTAYDFYQRGREEHLKFQLDYNNRKALERAENFYRKALEYDSTFAQAYAGLAMTHYSKHYSIGMSMGLYSDTYFKGEFLDSVLMLANLALTFDNQIEEAYSIKGLYYEEKGNLKEALDNYLNELIINPNYTMALRRIGNLYALLYDYVEALSNLHKAASIDRGSLLPVILGDLADTYWYIGFGDKAEYYSQEMTSLTGDSIRYYLLLWLCEFQQGNIEKAFKYAKAAYELDSTHIDAILYLGAANLYTMHYQEAYKYYSKYYELLKKSGELDPNDMQRMGYVLWEIGKKDEARYFFNELIRLCKESIRLKNTYARQGAHYDLAGVYAFLGDKELAYKHLEEFTKTNYQVLYIIVMLKQQDPLFDSIREEERFQKLLQNMEAKYQAEHERVRKWMEEKGM